MRNFLSVFSLVGILSASAAVAEDLLVEAESFRDLGGWSIDQQSMDQMGSPYLLAHGLGEPVKDAVTTVRFKKSGRVRVWVRTRDWVAPWKKPDTPKLMRAEGCPGRFQLLLNGKPIETTFGTEGADWHWQSGGILSVSEGEATLSLHDLTGFDGRCDAILFQSDLSATPPHTGDALRSLRVRLGGISARPRLQGEYDLVVVGGGTAGVCLSISAARQGCKVALLQDRPVLGGNNSSEVRVGLSGLIFKDPYPSLGKVVDEMGPIGYWNLVEARKDPKSERSKRILEVIRKHPEKRKHNAGPATNYEDQQKMDVVLAEKNISLFMYTHMNGVTMKGNQIDSVIGQNIRTGERLIFKGTLFADCTGDGNLGALAKADFRMGREPRKLTGETLAPEKGDDLVMGTSVQWYALNHPEVSSFPEVPWAMPFTAKNAIRCMRGDWNWETGFNLDQIEEIEQIRDYALRVTFGNWSALKNDPKLKAKYAKSKLEWVAFIGGKRESRRLLGDHILTQQDIDSKKIYPDACVTTTWTIDLHTPNHKIKGFDPFLSYSANHPVSPYPIPYRCLYSRNVNNLFMAGRNISVTHVALGTVRVMRTTGMMGEALGLAAGLCKKYRCMPRSVYQNHLDEFKKLLEAGVPDPE